MDDVKYRMDKGQTTPDLTWTIPPGADRLVALRVAARPRALLDLLSEFGNNPT